MPLLFFVTSTISQKMGQMLQVRPISSLFTRNIVSAKPSFHNGTFTQGVLRGVISVRLGHLSNKKCFCTIYTNDRFTPHNLPQCERYFKIWLFGSIVCLYIFVTLGVVPSRNRNSLSTSNKRQKCRFLFKRGALNGCFLYFLLFIILFVYLTSSACKVREPPRSVRRQCGLTTSLLTWPPTPRTVVSCFLSPAAPS